MVSKLILRTKPLRIAINMLCCALLFCWARPYPRETISGLFGRKAYQAYFRTKRIPIFWNAGMKLIDALHQHEVDHCVETAKCEEQARRVLGYS